VIDSYWLVVPVVAAISAGHLHARLRRRCGPPRCVPRVDLSPLWQAPFGLIRLVRLLGLGSQGVLSLLHLGRLCGLPARTGRPSMARKTGCLTCPTREVNCLQLLRRQACGFRIRIPTPGSDPVGQAIRTIPHDSTGVRPAGRRYTTETRPDRTEPREARRFPPVDQLDRTLTATPALRLLQDSQALRRGVNPDVTSRVTEQDEQVRTAAMDYVVASN
jgi:hypothetical protein